MSAPDPEKWQVTGQEFKAIASGVSHWLNNADTDGDKRARRVIERVARRRALAELKALHHGFVVCGSNFLENLENRIAEIEAEEA